MQAIYFMHLCRLNYLGHGKRNVELYTLKVCSQISAICQVYYIDEKICHDTLDNMFDKYACLAASLPDNSSGWSIQLCLCFLSVLSENVVERVTSESKFRMPSF